MLIVPEIPEPQREGVRTRLNEVKTKFFGDNAAGMARAIQMDRVKLYRILTGDTQKIETDLIDAVASSVTDPFGNRVSERWLLTGEEPMLQTGQGDGRKGEPPDAGSSEGPTAPSAARHVGGKTDLVITVRTAIRASAKAEGASGWMIAEGDEHESEQWHVTRQRIYDLIGVWLQPGDDALYIEGWSMKRPGFGLGLDDGQLVIYRPLDTFVNGQRHVIQIEAVDYSDYQVVCKRVQVFAGGAIRLISDNRSPGFSDELLIPENGHYVNQDIEQMRVRLKVMGRVLWPREQDEEHQIRLITQTIEEMMSSKKLRL